MRPSASSDGPPLQVTLALARTFSASTVSRYPSARDAAALARDVQQQAASEARSEFGDRYGVNLDEEAAELLRYQQAYQASAQVIRIANELFDSLLDAAR